MKINPIYRQESRAGARSFKLPLIILGFNSVLAVVALLSMYSMITQVRLTAEIQYSSFLGLYTFVATVEFVLLLFIIPGLTAGSISGERERQTLDLMLTTRMQAADIVVGKLVQGLSTVFLLIVSSFPILGLVFIYGGVTMPDVGRLLLCYVVTAVLLGSAGLFCSALMRRSTMATVSAYSVMVLLTAGTLMVNYLADGLAEMTSVGGEPAVWPLYLLLGNPAALFQSVLSAQTGSDSGLGVLLPQLERVAEMGFLGRHWQAASAAIQLLMAGAFLWQAVKRTEPARRKPRRARTEQGPD